MSSAEEGREWRIIYTTLPANIEDVYRQAYLMPYLADVDVRGVQIEPAELPTHKV